MSSTISAKDADINLINSERLQINQTKTDLKWNTATKHKDITVANLSIIAKLRKIHTGSKAILGSKGYVIGTASESITYAVYNGKNIHVGLAEVTRDLTSLEESADLLSVALNDVPNDTSIQLNLTPSTLTILKNERVFQTVDLAPYTGLTMHPWLSDDADAGSGFSVGIFKAARMSVYIDTSGTVVFETLANNGVDRPIKFDTGAASVQFTGGSLIADTVHNVVESDPGTPLVLRETGGADVTINASGDIDVPGTVTASSGIMSSIKSTGASTLNVTENGGAGLHIATLTGNASFDADVSVNGTHTVNAVTSNSGSDLDLVESSNKGIHVTDSTGDVTVDEKLTVVKATTLQNTLNVSGSASFGGNVSTSSVLTSGASLTLRCGGAGISVANGSGDVTVDGDVYTNVVKSEAGQDLQLFNDSDLGLKVIDTTGALTASNILTINNSMYGTQGGDLVIQNNVFDALGLSIEDGTGNVLCDTGLSCAQNFASLGSVTAATIMSVGPTSAGGSVVMAMSSPGANKGCLMPSVAGKATVVTPVAGMVIYDTSDDKFYGFYGGGAGWKEFSIV